MYKVFTRLKCVYSPSAGRTAGVRGGPEAAPGLPAGAELNYPQTPFDGLLLPRMKNGAGASARVLSASGGGLRGAARLPGRGRDQSPVALRHRRAVPRQCLHRLLTEHPRAGRRSRRHRLNELIWREFYRHLMVYYPKLCKGRPFTARTDKVAARRGLPTGSAGRPVFQLLMPPCASLTPPAGCITGCA